MILDRNTVLLEGTTTRNSRVGKVFEQENQLADLVELVTFKDEMTSMPEQFR